MIEDYALTLGRHFVATVVTVDGPDEQVVSGLRDLVLLRSTGPEFAGFLWDGVWAAARRPAFSS